jgi:hypothetical protein
MKGRHYANVFVHYEPIDHSANNKHDRQPHKHLDKAGLEALQAKLGAVGGHEALNHDEGEEDSAAVEGHENGQTLAHITARGGDLELLVDILKNDPDQLYIKDINGWQPLHEVGGALLCVIFVILVTAVGCPRW